MTHPEAGPAAPEADGAGDEHDKEHGMMQAANCERDRAVKILARSIFRELKKDGYETRQIVALSTELLGLVTSSIRPSEVDSQE